MKIIVNPSSFSLYITKLCCVSASTYMLRVLVEVSGVAKGRYEVQNDIVYTVRNKSV